MLTGIFMGLGISIVVAASLYVGYRIGTGREKAQAVAKLSEEEEKKQKLRNEGIQNIMNYDYEKALGRR